MVRRIQITLSQAIEGFMLEKRAQQRSERTLADYGNAFRKLQAFVDGDPRLDDVSADDVRRFLRELGERAVAPAGIAPRAARPLSKKSIYNIHTALSSLWSWAVREGYADVHVLRMVPRPRPERRAIVPYTKGDVEGLLAACEQTREYQWKGRRACRNARPTALRDRAMILTLLDTGMRASELCGLRVGDWDAQNQRVKVFGKGARERLLHLGRRTSRAVWRYLATRPEAREGDALFAQGEGIQGLNRKGLRLLIRRLGDRAGIVPAANVHRFRHTFAIHFLRNGGDAYSLQAILGHSTLEMVRRYLAIVQADTENAHRRASPVDRWGV